ncbi:hypothetical protein [Hyalangium sp.]|uniref:hypothetical protein n=1 Tax=Hyalangium sp. TaxID=2028555 RepID=UPI002D372319|nr:hypothetical protein [Hyalangium sp.]HYI02114.1 hypothetical protein [Hyalangium sp.]
MRIRQLVTVTAWVVGCVAALGCGGDPAQETKTYYYNGTNTTRSPDGQVMGMGETLLRRVFDGPNSQIIEHVLTKDAQQGVQENTLTFAVTGATFQDTATGFTGELQGDPWKWSEWTAYGALPNGLKLESTSTISEDQVSVDMKFKNGDALQFTLKHEVTATTQSDFEQKRSQWIPQ